MRGKISKVSPVDLYFYDFIKYVSIVSGNEVSQIRETVLKWITDNWKKGNIPPNWPLFEPLTAATKEALIEKLHLDNRTAVIVVEKDASNLGREVRLLACCIFTTSIAS